MNAAAVSIRDAIGNRFDERYATVVNALGALRRRLLADQGRVAWRRAVDTLVGADFCERVERGTFAGEVTAWP